MRAPAEKFHFDCSKCTERERKNRNCHNRIGYKETLVEKSKWGEWTSIKPVCKWGDLKFYECQLTVITRQTWEIIRLVNETTNAEGDVLHLPFEGAWTEQPQWYRDAVRITKHERSKNIENKIEAEDRRKALSKIGASKSKRK